jgi:glycosyltransferase involved in cell wall biosynthesis
MLIGIDAQTANQKKRTGVQWYSYYLIEAMKQRNLGLEDQVFLYSSNFLYEDLIKLPEKWESKILRWPFKRGWQQGRLSFEMYKNPPNVLFVPGQRLPRIIPHKREKNQATITMIHDVGFKRHPELFLPSTRHRLQEATQAAIKQSTRLLVPSIFTKQEVQEFYEVPEERLFLTPLGVDLKRYHPLNSVSLRLILDKYRLGNQNYFLVTGRVEKKKNSLMILRAFERFKQNRGLGDPFELVFVGPPGEGFAQIQQAMNQSIFREKIHWFDWVSAEDIVGLINGAIAYLFPSWYEGFGLPNLEALACGTMLLTSDIPVHREVVGEAGLFLPIEQPEAWAQTMHEITINKSLKEDFQKKGFERIMGYTWQKTADLTWQAILTIFD